MAKNSNFMNLENVRVAFDRKTNNIVITSTDKRLKNNLLFTLKHASPAFIELQQLLHAESVNITPSKQSLDFDGINHILNSGAHKYLVVGNGETSRHAFGLKVADESIKKGILTFVMAPTPATHVKELLQKAQEFRQSIIDHPVRLPRITFVRDFEFFNKWSKEQAHSSYGQGDYGDYDVNLKYKIELYDVLETLEDYPNAVVVDIGVAVEHHNASRLISFIPYDARSLKATAENFRVGENRLRNITEMISDENYIMYANGDLQVGTV